jgi:DNA-binding MarR family transcriptional regulator
MSESVDSRQHVVNQNPEIRPKRTRAGDLFSELALEVAWLGGIFSAAGEVLASAGGQSLARWLILDAIEDEPSTVASVARRRGIARQAVQRVADLLVEEGLAAYAPNPGHRRAKLLVPTPAGRAVLHRIAVEQVAWADRLGAEIGERKLSAAVEVIASIRPRVVIPDIGGTSEPPAPAGRPKRSARTR